MKSVVLFLIKIYQKTLSLDHGLLGKLIPLRACRFKPTCSAYSYQSISKYGLIKGGWQSVKRVLRCNPYNKGGYDPVK